jgi:T5orf172 domain-containing protein
MGEDGSGWVYVMTSDEKPGVVKIGHSRVGVDERCFDLSFSGYPMGPFTVSWSGSFPNCRRVELGAHRILEECRLRHDLELFVTSVDRAREAILRSDREIRRDGQVQAPRYDGAPKPSLKSRRLRIPALYAWLKENHDAVFERIRDAGSEGVSTVTPVFETLVSDWLTSLPSDYRGRKCQPLGLFMEWGRVHQEVMFDRERNRPHLLEKAMDVEESKSVFVEIQGVIETGSAPRSALLQWMLDNHDELLGMLENKRPNWKRLAEVFTKLGFSDGDKALRGETVRHYWWRARKIKQGFKSKRSRSLPGSSAEGRPVEVQRSDVRVHAPQEPVRRPPDVVRPVPGPVDAASGTRAVAASGGSDHDAEGLLSDLMAEIDKRSGR